MANMVRSEYTEVKDPIVKWCVVLGIASIILLTVLSFVFDTELIPLLILTIPIVLITYGYADRRCATCKNKMSTVTHKNRTIMYCCDQCKTKITSKVKEDPYQ
jgi:hypothetical protein